MNIYKDLEDSLYNVLIELFPTMRIIFAYNNAPEPQTPYVAIDVKKLDQIGNEYSSTMVDDYLTTPTITTQMDILAKVRFEVVGKADEQTSTSEMASNIQFFLRTQKGYDIQDKNGLACHGKVSIRRMPLKRETDMYMLYQVDAYFAYTVTSQDDQDWIEVTDFTGVYHDAGREPDHTITTHTEINPNP